LLYLKSSSVDPLVVISVESVARQVSSPQKAWRCQADSGFVASDTSGSASDILWSAARQTLI